MGLMESIGSEFRALRGDGKGLALASIAGGWGLLLGTRMIYPVLLPYLRTTFDLSLTIAGLLVTVLWLGSAVGQLPGGLVADRYSERVVLAASTFIVAVSIGVLLVAATPLALFAATALVGLGQSLYPIARITMLSDIYPDRLGSALGLTMATGDLGQTLLPPIGGALAAAIAWQAGLAFIIPLLVPAGIALWVYLPAAPPSTQPVGEGPRRKLRLVADELRQPNLLFVAFILFLYAIIWQSFTGLYPTYLIEEKGLSSALAGLLFSLFFAIGIVVKPLAGTAYDRVGIRGSLIMMLVGPTIGLAALPFVSGLWPLVAVTALVSSMLGSGTITQSHITEAFSEDVRGTGLGVVRTVVLVLGAMGPVILGGIADLGFFDEGYLFLAAIMAAVIVFTLRIPRS